MLSNTNNINDSTSRSYEMKAGQIPSITQTSSFNNKEKQTWIPLSLSPIEYEKLGFDPVISAIDQKRFEFVNQTKGSYKRIVTSIKKVRTDDNKLWLDWNETREGKTSLGRKLSPLMVPFVGKKTIPIPTEETVFNEQYETYEVKTTVGRETREEYWLPFSLEALQELLEDVNPYRAEYLIMHHDKDAYTVTPEELKDKDFEKVYSSKVAARSSKSNKK